MAIVGGARKPLGPVIGACALLTIVACLPAAESQGMVYGGGLIPVLLVAPRGLVSLDWRSLRRRPGPATETGASKVQRMTCVGSTAGEYP